MSRAILRGALALLLASSLRTAVAQTPPADTVTVDPLHQAGRNVTISLLTMGTGKEIWELFGHNAIWIHDNVTSRDTVFNWGVFDFHQPNFIGRFLMGRMLYAMGGDSLSRVMWVYRYLNRTVRAQELDLTAAQRDSVLSQIRWYAQPENVNYRYDYFLDNCSTRVRDIINRAVGGQLQPQAAALTRTTYRWHALRLMQSDRPIVVGVDIGLGRPSDRELTRWQEMFLPTKLHDFAAEAQIPDSSGVMRPLVRREQVLFQGTRPPEPDAPPQLGLWLTILGLGLGGLMAWLGVRAWSGGRAMRRTAAVVFGLWAFVAGLLGALLSLLWGVTDHVSAHANENLFLFNPLWLVLGVMAVAALWTGRAGEWTRRMAWTLAGLCVLGLLIHLVLLSAQNNWALIGLALPPALAMAWVFERGRKAVGAL